VKRQLGIWYRYFGVFDVGDRASDDPIGVIRLPKAGFGFQEEQVFTRSLIWERPSHPRVSSMARSHWDDVVEIDKSVVKRFIKILKEEHDTR
jgi:hypothetical protein